MKKSIFYKYLFLMLCFWVTLIPQTKAQGGTNVIILSGIVVDKETNEPLPGVSIYIPKAGRGVGTSSQGLFAIGVLPGDSLIISSLNYKKRFYRVPKDKTQSYSVVIELNEQITNLPVVEVFPYPTEEAFKEAVLALQLPDEEQMKKLQENMNPESLAKLAMSMPMDATMNTRYFMMRDAINMGNQTFLPTLPLLDPFAWGRLIKSIKNGDFKRGKYKDRRK
jgi:hypothetical protein